MQAPIRTATLALVSLLAAAPVQAQSGLVDQVSPAFNASLNTSLPSLVWQQEVRVGLAGKLSGIEFTCQGWAGVSADVRIKLGPGWNLSAPVFSGVVTKSVFPPEVIFVDMSSANLTFMVGDVFTIEVQGNDSGLGMEGSGLPALYPEPLHLNQVADGTTSLGFTTYVDDSVGSSYCMSSPNSTGSPALISAFGSDSVATNQFTLVASSLPAGQNGIFFYGGGQSSVPFGNGTRCASSGGVGIFRFPIIGTGTGTMTYPADLTTPPSPSGMILAGSTWYFQAWFRDPAAGGSSFDLTDGLAVTFQP